jgi:hypothetical protein
MDAIAQLSEIPRTYGDGGAAPDWLIAELDGT